MTRRWRRESAILSSTSIERSKKTRREFDGSGETEMEIQRRRLEFPGSSNEQGISSLYETLKDSCKQAPLVYHGSSHFRTRIVLATIASRPVLIRDIRSSFSSSSSLEDDVPRGGPRQSFGLRRHEASLLRLMDKITEGTVVEIDESGTEVFYSPGCLLGGDADVSAGASVSSRSSHNICSGSPRVHDCGSDVCVTYFLEALLMVAPFAKYPLDIVLKGVTQDEKRASVDIVRTVTLPLLKMFVQAGSSNRAAAVSAQQKLNESAGRQLEEEDRAIDQQPSVFEGLTLQIQKRGCRPLGGGSVRFGCPTVKKIEPFVLLEEGRIRRIRGVAFTCRVAAQYAARMGDRARALLNPLLKDVYIFTENHASAAGRRGADGKLVQNTGGFSEGYGITLVAQTSCGGFKGADCGIDSTMGKDVHSLDTIRNIVNVRRRSTCAAGGAAVNGNKSARGLKTYGQEVILPEGDVIELVKNKQKQPPPKDDKESTLAACEWVGKVCASRLLLELSAGGIVDSSHQYLPLLLMALSDEYKASKVKLSRLTPYTVSFVRHLRDFFGTVFQFTEAEQSTVIAKCIGIGYTNLNKTSF